MIKKFKFRTTHPRSELMKKIRSRNTKPEIDLRKAISKFGYHYRLNSSKLPGKPDLVFNKFQVVVFVDGEFWHGYKWNSKKKKIKANRKYWIPKIERNLKRDKINKKKLEDLGFVVLRFWEHEIKNDIEKCTKKILNSLNYQQ
jgi:DNA mismatch endonuclease (patch repair protein)